MQAAKESVLLVDDEPQVLVALEDLLGDDFVVFKTGSPEEALDMVNRDPSIAVVISDQRMPKMSGDELLSKLARSSDARKILVTAFADLSAVVRAVNEGRIFAYVTKPWDAEDLRHKVRSAAEHFRLAHELASERRLLNSILNSLNEGIVVADRNGKCLLFNPQAEKILGRGPAELAPETWAQDYGVFESENRKQPLRAEVNPLFRDMSGEQSAEIEAFVRNESVAGTTVAISATPLGNRASDVQGRVAVFRDVTQQRELESQLAQSQKMDAIGRLAGGVAHDFNNLLVVIQSYVELVREQLPSNDLSRADLGEVLSATRRASALTRQLLAFSRRETIHPTELQLNDVVAETEKMLRRIIGEDVELSTELSPELGVIRADAGQVEQVLLNLCINARDAMPDGGLLTLETGNVLLDADYADTHAHVVPGEYVLLAVTDTGTGMDADTQRRIFEPFFTTKSVGKGTGLGLATVYGIVQQSGAHIRVYSELGRGSTFKVYFPRVRAAAEKLVPEATSIRPRTSGGIVLVVEDDEAVRQVTVRILRQQGYTVLEARRPSDARHIFSEQATLVDLLLTDVIMPECTGPQLAKELVAQRPTMMVIYMSGYPNGAVARSGDLEPGAHYIGKPFSPAALIEKVHSVLSTAH